MQNRIEIIYGLSSFSTTIYYFIYILAGAGRKVFQFCFATSEIAPASSFLLIS